MSRTRKDRPSWVKMNDENVTRKVSHGYSCAVKGCHEDELYDDTGRPAKTTRDQFKNGTSCYWILGGSDGYYGCLCLGCEYCTDTRKRNIDRKIAEKDMFISLREFNARATEDQD